MRAANLMAIGGIAAVGLAVSSAVALMASVVYSGAAVPLIAALTFSTFFGLWFVLPMINPRRCNLRITIRPTRGELSDLSNEDKELR